MSSKLSKFIAILLLIVSGLWLSTNVNANIADDLTANYNKIVDNCGSAKRPAFLCSGVVIRATNYSPSFYVWDPSVGSITRGGVSFSYFRKDIKLKRLVHDRHSGYIFYPSSLRPTDKDRSEVLCSFPIDGWTDGRKGKGGCDAHINYPTNSGSCQSQGILSADAWYKHFTSVTGNQSQNQHQCSFNMEIGTDNTATLFNESLKAQQLIFPEGLSSQQNEIVIATWPTDMSGKTLNPEKLPIQAFFYIDEKGKIEAQNYQKEYFKSTFVGIPIVKITFPNIATEDVKFEYFKEDQQQICFDIIADE